MNFARQITRRSLGFHSLLALLVIFSVTCASTPCQATLILGTGTGALLGGDLTDPEDDGAPDADINYNATFASSSEPGFGGGEFAFNVFDNLLGPGNDKWCCNHPTQWVQATLPERFQLTHFTISSANDVPARDPVDWQIQGSNDGVSFTNIFTHAGSNIFTDRLQVHLFDADDFAGQGNASSDFALPALFNTFRFQVTAHGGDGGGFQLGELEFFGISETALIPEPSTGSIMLLGLAGWLGVRRRRRAA